MIRSVAVKGVPGVHASVQVGCPVGSFKTPSSNPKRTVMGAAISVLTQPRVTSELVRATNGEGTRDLQVVYALRTLTRLQVVP